MPPLRLTLLMLSTLLLACSVGPATPLPATVEISDELSPDDVEATLAAVDAWNKEVPGIITGTKVRHTPSKKERTIFVRRGKALVPDSFGHSKTTYCHSTTVIHDNAGNVFAVVAHEFGHAFGLDDNAERTSIMGSAATINADDAAEARQAFRNRRGHHRDCISKGWLGLN